MILVFKHGQALLEETYTKLKSGQIFEGMETLAAGLQDVRGSLPADDWKEFLQSSCLSHPIKDMIHQSPFTRRAFEKPRGYSGDAIVLDFIYGSLQLPDETSDFGKALYHLWEFQTPSCRSVRARREVLTAMVDELATQMAAPKIFSVACGHLREAQASKAVKDGRIGEYIGLDNDPATLEVIKQEQAAYGVKPVQGSVRSLLARKLVLNGFDFIYSAGLYDYLALPVATQLTSILFTMLKPGGRLLIANFAPNLRDIGYLEAFMDWRLIYRDEAEVERFASTIPGNEIGGMKTFREENGNIVFLEITRS